jgi:hypothetical protein
VTTSINHHLQIFEIKGNLQLSPLFTKYISNKSLNYNFLQFYNSIYQITASKQIPSLDPPLDFLKSTIAPAFQVHFLICILKFITRPPQKKLNLNNVLQV